jgi:hypothetical protein
MYAADENKSGKDESPIYEQYTKYVSDILCSLVRLLEVSLYNLINGLWCTCKSLFTI